MTITSNEKRFIKNNKQMLRSLFLKRIEELKDNVFKMKEPQNRDLEIRFVNELKVWLETIRILEKTKEKKKEEFI